MPSLKMKTKSTTGCLREKHGLHVCQKSSMISKSPLSRAGIPQNVEVVKTPIHSSQDVSLCKNESNIDGAEVKSNELLNAEDLVLQKEESPSSDFSVESRMGSESATCSSSLETIFSPIQELIDISSELFVCSDGGNNDLYVPQLETEDSDDSSRDSCKYQTCGMSDFYISDMIVSGLPVEGNSIYDDSTELKFLHHYQCNDEPTMFFDMTEDYMVMPFLEDTMKNGHVQDNSTCGETMIDSSDTRFCQAIHQVRSCNQESSVNYIPDSDQAECFDPRIFLRNLPDLPDAASNSRPQKAKPITLALDLDETLVHSTLEPCEDADFTFSVFFNMKEHIVYVKERPHLRIFLERVAEMFEIVIFTASQSIYAKQLLDILDPDGKLISRRAYRESCIFSDGTYTKDLNVLGVDLAKVVIVDNSPQVFRLQVNNGIPIKSWFDDPSDSALLTLLPFLETLADADDVRPIIAERFGHVETHIVLASIGIIVGMHSCLRFWNFMSTASTLNVTQFLIDVFP